MKYIQIEIYWREKKETCIALHTSSLDSSTDEAACIVKMTSQIGEETVRQFEYRFARNLGLFNELVRLSFEDEVLTHSSILLCARILRLMPDNL